MCVWVCVANVERRKISKSHSRNYDFSIADIRQKKSHSNHRIENAKRRMKIYYFLFFHFRFRLCRRYPRYDQEVVVLRWLFDAHLFYCCSEIETRTHNYKSPVWATEQRQQNDFDVCFSVFSLIHPFLIDGQNVFLCCSWLLAHTRSDGANEAKKRRVLKPNQRKRMEVFARSKRLSLLLCARFTDESRWRRREWWKRSDQRRLQTTRERRSRARVLQFETLDLPTKAVRFDSSLFVFFTISNDEKTTQNRENEKICEKSEINGTSRRKISWPCVLFGFLFRLAHSPIIQ